MKRLGPITAIFLFALASALALTSCGGGGTPITIEIQPSGAQSVDEGGTLNYTATLGNDTKNEGVTWTLSGSSCAGTGCGTLANSTNLSVTYQAPPSISSSISATLTATSVAQKSVTTTSTITVVLAPTFSAPCTSTVATCPLQGGKNGVPYSQTLTITGGVAPYTYTVTSGASSLAAECLSLNGLATGTTNTIVGTPCSSGTFPFTVQVKDSGGAAPISQTFSISITPPPPLSITTTSLPPGTTHVAYAQFIQTQGGVPPLTFSLVGGGTTPVAGLGLTLNLATGEVTGIPLMTGSFSFQVSVKDSSLPSGQPTPPSTISISVQAPPPLSITTPSLPTGTVATAYSASFQATGGIPPYTWTLPQGQLPPGLTFSTLTNGTGGISGTPSLATTATFTVEVTDSEIPAVTTSPSTFTLTINPGTANANGLFSGAYAFFFSGFDKNGTVAITGMLAADGNGNITTGTETSNRAGTGGLSGVQTPITLAGTYSVGTDGRGSMELTAVNSQGTPLVIDYQMALDSNGNWRFFENNAPNPKNATPDILGTHGEGILKPMLGLSFSAGSFNGNYAFEFSGQDFNGKREALAGAINADGSSNMTPPGSGVNSDLNDAGTYSSQPISGTFILAPPHCGSATNCGLAQFLFQQGNSQTTLTFIFYFVSTSDIYFVELDAPNGTTFPNPPRLSGEMILQQPTTNFGSGILSGTSVVTGSGVDGSNASVLAGLLSAAACDGSTAASFTYDQNDAGSLSSSSFSSGSSCKVTPNGRVSFSGFGATPRVAVAYLTGPGQGFLLGSDAAVTTGLVELQSGAPFSLTSFEGTYALGALVPAEPEVPNVTGQVVDLLGTASVSGTVDEYDPPATATPEGVANLGQALTATINPAATGRGTMTTNGLIGFPTNLIFYMISPGSFRAISNDSGVQHPQVFFFDH